MVEFSLAKESFVNGLVMPILSWHLRPLPATETRPARPERYYTKPSGLQPVGADLLTPIEIEDGVITKDHIQAIYKDSLFPTAKELLEDNVLKHVLGNKFKNDKTGILESNYRMVVDYINEEWVSSSIALMNAFPGAHYHLICRVPMNNSQHAKLRIAPKRKAKESGRAKIKANVTKRRSTTKLAESMIPKLLRGDDWEKLEWRRFGNSFNKFASKEELPPIYPPLMGRKDGPMSWSETQRQWAMKELQIMKHKELKEKGKLPKKKKRKTKKKSRRNY
jgi:hypothetical protein